MFRSLSFLAGLTLAPAALADEPLTLTLAETETGQLALVFDSDMLADDAFILRSENMAVPDTRLVLSIDRSPTPLLDHVLTGADCAFEEGSPGATCTVMIEGGSPPYSALVEAFKAGLEAHIDVRHPGHAAQRSDVSLIGFTAAFRNL